MPPSHCSSGGESPPFLQVSLPIPFARSFYARPPLSLSLPLSLCSPLGPLPILPALSFQNPSAANPLSHSLPDTPAAAWLSPALSCRPPLSTSLCSRIPPPSDCPRWRSPRPSGTDCTIVTSEHSLLYSVPERARAARCPSLSPLPCPWLGPKRDFVQKEETWRLLGAQLERAGSGLSYCPVSGHSPIQSTPSLGSGSSREGSLA